jgi:hypothetical protein
MQQPIQIWGREERTRPVITLCMSCCHVDNPPGGCNHYTRQTIEVRDRMSKANRLVIAECSGYTPAGDA